ncbi:unnamed protein product [Angiostrongylus costaricensis]|uniref:BRCT domain-containing protein n=1 Tax=Angiostrongylus costaricensis TaxID=334426 RepID=A0A158PKF3_ANGCS|nr:unnamed protein product [Angiostrongylus costaricensis]
MEIRVDMGDPKAKTCKVYKLVLTGGPCGGKTTGQDRLATFFENIGWKVFTVPETATILLGGRVKFAELNYEQTYLFQKDLLKTMLQIEDTYFHQAESTTDRNVLVICDRGGMDPSAYIDRESWLRILSEVGVDEFDLLNKRYDQVVHLVTAADGAESYYTLCNNSIRKEDVELAREMDQNTRKVWLGHPYFDIVDNTECIKFEDKVLKVIQRKWLVRSIDNSRFVKYEQFNINHEYLLTYDSESQVCYGFFFRAYMMYFLGYLDSPSPLITFREYKRYQTMKDKTRASLHKQRRCFMVGNQYFNLDIYTVIPPSAISLQLDNRLIFLETYTTIPVGQSVQLPDFLEIEKEVTGQLAYSMYSMSKIPNVGGENEEFHGAHKYIDD